MEWARVCWGPEGKTELPHKVVRREEAIDSKSNKMSCSSPRTDGFAQSQVCTLSGKGEAERRQGRAGPCFSLVIPSSPWPFHQVNWHEMQNATTCSHLQSTLQWPSLSLLVTNLEKKQKQNLPEENIHTSLCGFSSIMIPEAILITPYFSRKKLSATLN